MFKKQHHIHCMPDDVAPYALLVGDHARVDRIAKQMEDSALVNETRGYRIATGTYRGVRVSAVSTGMGPPQTAIAVEELGNLGVHTFIRVGSCGARADHIDIGDIIITHAAYRDDGTSGAYLPYRFPAVASLDVIDALRYSARSLGIDYKIGITSSGDAFYGRKYDNHGELLKKAGIATVEMESSALFIVAQYRGFRAGTILTCSDGRGRKVTDPDVERVYRVGEKKMITVALEAVATLAAGDTGDQ